jgi:Notch-like protein
LKKLLLLGAAGLFLGACGDSVGLGGAVPACLGDACAPAPDAAADATPPDAGDCVPQGEVCDGLDNDCDGLTDESFPDTGACGDVPNVGACRLGERVCREGAVVCEGVVGPAAEACNGVDDDCNGLIDDAPAFPPGACGPANVCGEVPAECRAGEIVCLPPRTPAPETCNGMDDDCNGVVDDDLPVAEGIGQACGSATGLCRPGVRACVAGAPVCQGETPPSAELCNGQDDDCNGVVDDATVDSQQPCGEGELCAAGSTVCEAGALRCEGARPASAEVCNGVDDDCDGESDEADPMLAAPCGSNVGACQPGEIRCVAGSLLCFGGVSPTDEGCDGEDNDCDGEVDEADDQHGGRACPAQGDTCDGRDQCGPDRLCVDDYGQRYCTPTCDAQADCDAGYTCRTLGQGMVCRRDYPPCVADAECGVGEHCMLIGGARDPSRLSAECRPDIVGGLPVDADCSVAGAVCASNLCLGPMERCSALCDASAACGDAMACIRTPFVIGDGSVVEVGLCLAACGGDADCDPAGTGRLCQYDLATGAEGIIGHCDARREGAAVGQPCDLNAMPAQTCDHGYCRRDPAGRYCTQGCQDDGDCLAGWHCTPTPFNTDEGPFSVGMCQRP